MNSWHRNENPLNFGKLRYFWTGYPGNFRSGSGFQRCVVSGPDEEQEEEKELGLVEAYVDIDLRVLRIAAALVVDFKVGFIGSAAAKL